MRYDLPKMRAAGVRRRKPRRFRVRKPAERFERELAAIFLEVVRFWEQAYRDPQAVQDAEPDEVREVGDEVLMAALILRLRRWLGELAEWQRATWVRQILEATGIDLSSLAEAPVASASVLATLGWAEELLRDVSRQAKTRVTAAMTDATLRQLPKAAAKELVTEALDRSRSRARNIAHDMVGKFHGQINEALQEEASVEKYKWNHSFRPNARRHHVERQGNIYEWKKPPPDGHPGHAPNCRCTAEPVF